jgi:uncharacterized protein (DUF1684 family)
MLTLDSRTSRSRRAPRIARIVPIARIAAFLFLAACWADPWAPGGAAGSTVETPDLQAYVRSIQEWRAERDARLRSDSGWLTIAGLFWLEPGENTFGTDSADAVVLPAGTAPGRAGTFVLQGEGADARVTVRALPGTNLRIGEVPVQEQTLQTDEDGRADRLTLGRVVMWVIRRGNRYAVRLRDPESPLRKSFQGIDCFPIDPSYRVSGDYAPFAEPRSLPVPNILGYADSSLCYGEVRFSLLEQPCRLIPLTGGPTDSSLFLIFRDETSGKESYGGGRFLSATLRPGGKVELDFNEAYNPPCAFNPYTTCPLPPPGNDLPLAVRAGEMAYREPAAHPGR